MYHIWEPLCNKLKKYSVSKIALIFLWLDKLFNDLKTFANSRPSALNFSKFFPIAWTIFSHRRLEQFLKQNTCYHFFSNFNWHYTSKYSGHKFKNIDTFWPVFGRFWSKLSIFFFLILDIASVNSGHKSEVIDATKRKSRPREDSNCTKNSSRLFDSEGKELCRTLSVLT